MVQKIHPRVTGLRMVTCQKKNDDLAVQYEDVHGLANVFALLSWL